MFMFLSRVYAGIADEKSKMNSRCRRDASFMHRLYNIGARTGPRGIPAAIFLGDESSPSAET
jgi:hypothetical protein